MPNGNDGRDLLFPIVVFSAEFQQVEGIKEWRRK